MPDPSRQRPCAAVFLLLTLFSLGPLRAEEYIFYHENVLGTSLEIQVAADSRINAAAAEERILHEIDRQAKIFSSYDRGSEWNLWQQTKHEPKRVSPELFAIMQASDEWRKLSGGAFNPACEELVQLWRQAAESNEMPTKDELSKGVKLAAARQWELDAVNRTATRLSAAAVSFNAIAKGYIVEAACNAALRNRTDIHGLVVNLGGDLRVCGRAVKPIGIADPFQAAENAPPLTTIFVEDRAVATSGGYRRGVTIGNRRFSHIIDPRTGQPSEHVVSATVIAKSSTDADALATICNVLPPRESIALVESQGADCLLVTREGQKFQSRGWESFEKPRLIQFVAAFAQKEKEKDRSTSPKGELLELVVDFELSRPDGAQYRRPYVAIWLEDADDNPVRTALLFMMTKEPGPRWHRNLNRWYKQDSLRRQAGGRGVISTVSSASRGPGAYQAVFDGNDDEGQPLKAGKYTLFIEVAREHGTYQIIRQPLELGAQPIETTQLKSNVELKSASFQYRKPEDKPRGR